MNSIIDINTRVRASAKATLAQLEAVNAARDEYKAKKETLESLPRTPTGKLKKDVAKAIETIRETYEGKDNDLSLMFSELKAALREAANFANGESGDEGATFSALSHIGYVRMDDSLFDSLVSGTKSINLHNNSEGVTRDQRIRHVQIHESDRVYIHHKDGAMVVLGTYEEINGYFIKFAGSHYIGRSEHGNYIPSDKELFSMFSNLSSGKINLSAIGEERDYETIARLTAIISLIKAAKELRVGAPIVGDHSKFINGIDSARYSYLGKGFGVDRLADLKGLAEGRSLSTAVYTVFDKNDRVLDFADLHVDGGYVPENSKVIPMYPVLFENKS